MRMDLIRMLQNPCILLISQNMNGSTLQVEGVSEVEELLVVGQSLLEEQDNYMSKNLQVFETIKSNYLQVNRLRQLMQEQVKNDLQALADEYKQIAEKPDRETEVSEIVKQEQQLCQEFQSVQKNQQELSAKCQALQKEREKLLEEKENLSEEKERLANETMISLPKRREELSLFNNISRIRWDFEGSKNDVRGYISNKTDVKPFCFDKRKCSQFFITNSLWDSMKED
ncbi:kinetochore protein Spc24-like isoform X2 [Mercenaria mercenaria]|uniref:kinetochore protein Spc24-like isoform X2 n=1 Tax=Mercenaria mercenaria TaxID=6596 RepID=UPI00234F8EB0|nr:kinetochore protein Spc24-like isoform X2 [Mercenaria mercenaria]